MKVQTGQGSTLELIVLGRLWGELLVCQVMHCAGSEKLLQPVGSLFCSNFNSRAWGEFFEALIAIMDLPLFPGLP